MSIDILIVASLSFYNLHFPLFHVNCCKLFRNFHTARSQQKKKQTQKQKQKKNIILVLIVYHCHALLIKIICYQINTSIVALHSVVYSFAFLDLFSFLPFFLQSGFSIFVFGLFVLFNNTEIYLLYIHIIYQSSEVKIFSQMNFNFEMFIIFIEIHEKYGLLILTLF